MKRRIDRGRGWSWAAALFFLCLFCYVLTAYGGIRSPDGENVFWVAESLATRGSFAVRAQFASWENFMLARGRDGRLYSCFAPAQSVLLAPLVKLAARMNRTGWYEGRPLPVSFVNAVALKAFVYGTPVGDRLPHALRFLVSFVTAVLTALLMVVFFFFLRRITASSGAAFVVSVLLALATPYWSYSATMFKEPLTVLWVLLAFYCLAANDQRFSADRPADWRTVTAGLCAGLAVTAHITALLFVPFLLVYALYPYGTVVSGPGLTPRRIWQGGRAAALFIAGFLVSAGMFGYYNYFRFGHILETGRNGKVALSVKYAVWAAPWEGIWGLLVSPGKGLFWFSPLVLAGLLCWRRLHREHRFLSILLAVMIVFRLVIIAARSDWHGGFCLGPRHLLPVLPFLLIPLGYYLARPRRGQTGIRRLRRPGFLLFGWACISQQVYFCLGEPISFYYIWKHYFLARGISIIADSRFYLQGEVTPLLHLLEGKRGPFLFQHLPVSNYTLWAIGTVLAGVLMVTAWYYGLGRQCENLTAEGDKG